MYIRRIIERRFATKDNGSTPPGNGKPRERGAKTMQPEERRTETELLAEEEANEDDNGSESETATPPIDEDVASSVNAAVPDTADE